MVHVPVLQKEVIKYLDPKPNENFIDCTFGGGGHALAILEKILPKGRLLGIEWDEKLIQRFKTRNNLILICDNFANLKKIVKKENFESVSGMLFDLGISSWHLEKSGRGFSFLKDEPLDMRYNINGALTAQEIINSAPEKEMDRILKEYGEERFAKRIARNIAKERKIKPIQSTFQLVEIIKRAVPIWYQRRKIHFATKTFQALRITVNDELNNLRNVLPQALEVLMPGGRLIVISFHSLEDRIVKNFFRDKNKEGLLRVMTKKPLNPSKEEIKINPRSRSAKLRAAIKICLTA